MRATILLPAWAALCLTPGIAAAQFEPNDDFASRAILAPTVRSVSDSLLPSQAGSGPDTTLGAFNQSGTLVEFNDDNSPFGDGTASALYDIAVNSDGSIHLKVSGYPDCDFDGDDDYWDTPHPESGAYDLYVDVFDSGGSPLANLTFNDTLTAGGVIAHDLTGYASTDYYHAAIDNTPTVADDGIDYMTFTALPADEVFHAEITACDFDSLLGRFDDSGALIDDDDDSGAGSMSKLRGDVPASGEVHLAVTGCGDILFEGGHAEAGDYTLQIVTSPYGDATLDGTVDVLDLARLANHFGETDAEWEDADFNDDSIVDVLDLAVIANHFGDVTGGAGGGGPAPEPGLTALLAAGAAGVLARRRGGRRRS